MKIWRVLEDEAEISLYGIKRDYEFLGVLVRPDLGQPMAMFRKTTDPFPDAEDNDVCLVPMVLKENAA